MRGLEYFYCEYSNNFFDKLSYGCYNEFLSILLIICGVFVIIRVLYFFYSIIAK